MTAQDRAPLRVLIADDHPPTRAGVRQALEADGFAVVAEVGDARKAVDAAVEHEPDVCVLDIHMPGNGIDAAREIAHKLGDVSIVMLTASRDDDDLFEALRAGRVGYLLKDMDPDRLGPALRGVLAARRPAPRRCHEGDTAAAVSPLGVGCSEEGIASVEAAPAGRSRCSS
jgi:two-component system NarL family response regulator